MQDVELIYCDEHLAMVAKPSGMAVHRGWDREGPFALQLARDQVGRRVFPIHRLDRPTSGVLLFGLSPEAADAVQRQFQAGTVEKRYLALVRGIPDEHGRVDHPVPRAKDKQERVDAVTEYRRLAVFERYALVEARPETGRLHQIRRHMKHISRHIIGDVNYGKGEHNRWFRQEFGLHRLALHALSLRLSHPVTQQPLYFYAAPPADLAEPFSAMGFEADLWAPTGDVAQSSVQGP